MRRKKGCSCINLENGVDEWSRKNKGSCITFWMRGRRSAQPAPKTWCSMTKEQDFAGSEAPRLVCRQRLGPQRRGARRRKNKGLREAEHHVRYAGSALGAKDVVLDDERTRDCGERSTTSRRPAAPWAPKTWCLMTKEQGIAGGGAPRPVRRQRLGRQRRGA